MTYSSYMTPDIFLVPEVTVYVYLYYRKCKRNVRSSVKFHHSTRNALKMKSVPTFRRILNENGLQREAK